MGTANDVADSTNHQIETMVALDAVYWFDGDGSCPTNVDNWINVVAEDATYTWNDLIADLGGQWGEESGATNYTVSTDHNDPLGMLRWLINNGHITE